MTNQEIQKEIDKNREEINNLLSKDLPLDLLYIRIRMLSALNERLIKRLQ